MDKFKGCPYPIVKDAKGYFHTQKGIEQIKSDLLILLLTNPGERCLPGDTVIPLADGTEIPIKDLVGRETFWVYSYDHEADKIIAGKATAHLTAKDASLMKITLDDGSVVRCTPNHKWLLRDGSYKEASELTEGLSLMPLYRKLNASKPSIVGDLNPSKRPEVREKIRLAWEKRRLNHKILSVEYIEEKEDCYDLHVEKYHNFALSAGVFVHNCMLPQFGCPLKELVFEPNTTSLKAKARQAIINAINMWEPRISVDQIDVLSSVDESSLNASDDGTQKDAILMIRIRFFDPENINSVQELKLSVPLGGS